MLGRAEGLVVLVLAGGSLDLGPVFPDFMKLILRNEFVVTVYN